MLEEQELVARGERLKLIQEVWVPCYIHGSTYLVSNLGLVKNVKGRFLSQFLHYKDKASREKEKGYYCVTLKGDRAPVHQLVYRSFMGMENDRNSKSAKVIDHINGIQLDNRLVNLRALEGRTNSSKGNRDDSNGLF